MQQSSSSLPASARTPPQLQPIAPALSAVVAGLQQALRLAELNRAPDLLPQAREILSSGLVSTLKGLECELSKIEQLAASMERGKYFSTVTPTPASLDGSSLK